MSNSMHNYFVQVHSVQIRSLFRVGPIPDLELSVVQLVAVVEEELVRRPQAVVDAVFHQGAGPGRHGQLLNLCIEEF